MPAVVVALLLGGLAVRLLYLVTPSLDSDQAIFGLMAVHMLRGEFPIFQWGYHYMGTIESVVAAPLMLVFGPTRFALNLSPVLFSMLFAFAAWRFAREAFGAKAGLWALAFACFPSVYLVWTVVVARGAYAETLALGTLAAYFALSAVGAEDPRRERAALVGAGLALGVSFWTHLNTVIYGSAILLFWLVERPRLVRRAIVWAGGAFFLASAPFWYGTILAHFDTFLVTAPPPAPFAGRLSRLLYYRLPIVLGVTLDGGTKPTVPVVAWLIVPIQLAAFVATLSSAWAAPEAAARRGARLLLLIGAMLVLVYLASPFSGADTQRYLVPLYTLLAIAPAVLVARLAGSRRYAGAAMGLLLVLLQAVPSIRGADVFESGAVAHYRADRAREQRMFAALEAMGLYAVYADQYWDGARFTFDARERVVFSNPFADRRPEYLDRTDGAERAAFLFHLPVVAAAFEDMLHLAGARYQTKVVEGFLLYYDIVSTGGGDEIPVVAASASDNPIDAILAIDDDAATRWTSLSPQRPGMWFTADLGAEHTVAEVTFWPRFASDTPRGLRVELSANGHDWKQVAEAADYWGPCSWGRGRPVPSYDGWVVARFAPTRGRFVRLTEIGSETQYAWSIAELRVRAPATGRTPNTVVPVGTGRLFTDPVSAARTPRAVRHWQGETIRQFEHLRDVSLVTPADRLLVSPGDVIASGKDSRIGALADHATAIDGQVLVEGVRLDTDRLARRPATIRYVELAADRVVADLGAEELLAGVIVEHGEDGVSFPRGLIARVSLNGASWNEAPALRARPSRLFWSDEGLVGASFFDRAFVFATPCRARLVELTASPRHPKFPWAVRRVTALLAAGS